MTTTETLSSEAFTVRKGDAKIVSPCCDVVLHTGADLSSIADAVLGIYERFRALCPPDRLRWYATETTTRHKPVSTRSLGMLRRWLAPDAPARKVVSLDLKDGDGADEAPEYSFSVWGVERGHYGHGRQANTVRCTFPLGWAVGDVEALLAFTVRACTDFPLLYGHAGLVLETSPYYPLEAHPEAWRLSMQHPGFDVSNLTTDSLLGRRGIKGVNWLTMLGVELAHRLGGSAAIRQALPESVDVMTSGSSVILRAGAQPRPGDVTGHDSLAEYRAVYKLVAPLQEPIVQPYTSFSLPGGDRKAQTTAWLRRFAEIR